MYQAQYRILDEIDSKRELMISLASEKGFTSEEAIRCSQELDQLIYHYQQMGNQEGLKRKTDKLFLRQMILHSKKKYVLAHA